MNKPWTDMYIKEIVTNSGDVIYYAYDEAGRLHSISRTKEEARVSLEKRLRYLENG